MNFSFTDEQKAIQQMATEFAENELMPNAADWDLNSIFPIETFRKAAQLGFANIYISEKNGGCGLSRQDAVLIFEALSVGCLPTAAYLSIHNMVSWIVDTFGTEAQQKKWLPEMGTLEKLSSYCLTEPASGSDAASLTTKATRQGDFYVLNGEKCFISGGGVSDFYACMVRTSDEKAKGITCLMVEKGTPGLSFGSPEKKMGWRSQPTTTITFDNCRVPIENRLGAEGEGFKIAMRALNGGRLNIAACALGAAQRALKIAKDYMAERQQFGKRLNQFQALQFRYADLASDLEAARLMTFKGAFDLDNKDQNAPVSCAMAKRVATDTSYFVANEALQFLGGYGYMHEYQIERLVRDIRVTQILEGTNEVMLLMIAKALLAD